MLLPAEGECFDPLKTLNEIAAESPAIALILAQQNCFSLKNFSPRIVREALVELESLRDSVARMIQKTNGPAAPNTAANADAEAMPSV